MICEYCHIEIIPTYTNIVRKDFDNNPELPILYHKECYDYNEWLASYLPKLSAYKYDKNRKV